MKYFFFIAAFWGCFEAFASPNPTDCKGSFAQLEAGTDTIALQKALEKKVGPRALYQPVLSTDKDFLLKEVLMAEGPAPQKNMKLVAGSEQFRINPEAKAIFEQRKRLLARYPKKIVGVLEGEEAEVKKAAIEQFRFMLEELPEKSSTAYAREGDELVNLLTGDRTSVQALSQMTAREALEKLGQFVPDDLILMKKFGDEYRVVGGNLAAPTHWDMDFALGKTITEIHENLPGTPQSNAAFSRMINGVLDRTLSSEDIVRRNNWFIESDPRYSLPGYQTTAYAGPKTITKDNYKTSTFFRTERQTMRGLPESKMVTFSICPYVYPMGTLAEDKLLSRTLLDGIRVKLLPDAARGDDAVKIAKYLEQDLGGQTSIFETSVASLTEVSSGTRMLRVARPEGLNLSPGEAVRVTLDTPSGPQTRTLSLASAPDSPYLEFATRDSDSEFKQVFKTLTPKSKVQLELLHTSLEFKEDRPAVMIAGGIGITPFRSFIQHAKNKNLKTPMWLFYANRSEAPFGAELEAAAKAHQKLKVKQVMSQPSDAWKGARGRVDKAFLEKNISELPSDSVFYVVGAPQMVQDIRKSLRELGVPEERIAAEVYPDSAVKKNAPIDASKAQACDTVCFCHRVSAGDLRTAIDQGATSLDALKKTTKASTGCGGCASNVMGFLKCAGISQ